jgi:Fe2+ or Zn2+ uptake regulation protein
VDDVLALVRLHGGRFTSSRRLLLRALFDARGHRTAEELAADVPREAPDELFGGLARAARERFSFSIDRHPFAVLGRCADCR